MNESPIIMTLILKHHSGLEAALQPLLLLLYFSATLYNNVPTAAAAAVEQFEVDRLNYDSYDEMTESKTVFLKFFAPWYVFINILLFSYDGRRQNVYETREEPRSKINSYHSMYHQHNSTS
ncbi:MAG: hypothetical protein ACI8RD_002417 [Bacillariaceae sp.]|jgi:hypothetical protein